MTLEASEPADVQTRPGGARASETGKVDDVVASTRRSASSSSSKEELRRTGGRGELGRVGMRWARVQQTGTAHVVRRQPASAGARALSLPEVPYGNGNPGTGVTGKRRRWKAGSMRKEMAQC